MPILVSVHRPMPSRRCRSASRATTIPPVDDLAAVFERLNDAYEARFGFRYCVFVAGRSRAALLPDFEAALTADRDAELGRGLDAVIDIARDRHARLTSGTKEAGR